MKIREIVLEDKENVIDLMRKADNRKREEATRKFNNCLFTKKNRKILVAEEGNELVGYIVIKEESDKKEISQFLDLNETICVNWIAVLSEKRNKKVGSKLLKAAERYVLKWRKKGMWLDCREKVVPFYENNGYRNLGKLIKNNKEIFVMFKEIK